MNNRIAVIATMLCMTALCALTGQWTFDSESGLLSHDTSGWGLTASLSGTNLTVTGVSQTPASPSVLPLNDPVPGYALVSIGDQAFEYCFSLASVTIPDSVTSIGDWAFCYCFSLASVTIPDSVTSIGIGTFCYCSSLASVTIPPDVTRIGNSTFYQCSGLTSVTIPDSVTSIGDCAFYYCSSLARVTIPPGVTRIGNSTFYQCSSLTSVTIPDSVTSIGYDSFCGCGSLVDVFVGNGVTIIGDFAFSACNALPRIVLPAGIQSLGCGMLADCGSLTTVTFEGAFPSQVADALYGWEGSSSGATTSYLYSAHASSWEPHVAGGPLADGHATWQGCPVRVLPNPTASITVTLDKQGGAFTGPTSKTFKYGSVYGSLPTPTRAGCVFDCWWTGINGGGVSVGPTSIVSCTRNHTLYAKWLLDVTSDAAFSLGTTNLVWLTEVDPKNWRADGLVYYDNDGAMSSAPVQPGDATSFLRTSVIGPGLLQFHWKTSSENDDNSLRFYVDGAERADDISGETGWQKVTVAIPAGAHVLEWTYKKDGGEVKDCGWLDRVVWPAVAKSPEDDFWLWENTLFDKAWMPSHLFAARDGFTARLHASPDDIDARIYRAVTAVSLLTENADLRGLTEAFGLSLDTDLFTAAFAFTGTGAPPCNEAVDRAAAQALPALDAALGDLEAVPADWNGTVEIAAADSGFDETVYVDLADVLLAKSVLYALRAALRLAQAYDLSADFSKTNITEVVAAPFELPLLADPFYDSDFAEWNSVPAHLVGENGFLECVKLARSETQTLMLLQIADEGCVDSVYAAIFGENGNRNPFDNVDVSGIPDNELTMRMGYGWKYVINPDCPECGGWYEEVETEYTVLKSGGTVLLATDAEWDADTFRVSEAYASVQGVDPLTANPYYDWSRWHTESRIQPVPRFLEDHPNFLKTVRDAVKLPLAKESLRLALQSAQAAATSITGRSDEAMHFIELAPDQTNWLAEAQQKIAEALTSLDTPQSVHICHTNVEEVVNGYWNADVSEWVSTVETQRTEVVNRTEIVHLGAAFEPPYLTRVLLPRFSEDNGVILGSLADPTFGGVLPEWTARDVETNLLGRVPVMRERAFQMDGQWFHTGGYALWSYSDESGWGNVAQSGEVRRPGKVSWVETTLAGPGTLDFSWALTETDDRQSSLVIHVDGVRQPGGTIRGDWGWAPRLLEIPAGRHRVRWTYTLEEDRTEDATAEASLGWLTDFAWAPNAANCTATTPVAVPYAWLDGYPGLFGAGDDYESAALADQDGDGQTTWAEYVAGTHPSEPASAFMALIGNSGSGLEIGWTPNLTPARAYTVEGKADLRDAAWGPTNSATRFFRVKVSLP